MDDSITIGAENLISSKRASELSGYAQDYIGQLARRELIRGTRIAGLWYVSLESLNAYKSSADLYQQRPSRPTQSVPEADSIISFDGHDYISAARAARITGYTPDYVGQLARSGKIMARQIANRWYVHRDEILAHKREKDALLGAIQAQSVGIRSSRTAAPSPHDFTEPFFTYRTERDDLIAQPSSDKDSVKEDHRESDGGADDVHIPAIRRDVAWKKKDTSAQKKWPRAFVGVAGLTTVFMVLIGFLGVERESIYSYLEEHRLNIGQVASVSSAIHALEEFTDWVEDLFGVEIDYKRIE